MYSSPSRKTSNGLSPRGSGLLSLRLRGDSGSSLGDQSASSSPSMSKVTRTIPTWRGSHSPISSSGCCSPTWTAGETDDSRQLDLLLTDLNASHQLFIMLLGKRSPLAGHVRFLNCYNDYIETQDGGLRKAKGKKILTTFLQPGSIHQLRSNVLDEETCSQLRVDDLSATKSLVLFELLTDPSVVCMLKAEREIEHS